MSASESIESLPQQSVDVKALLQYLPESYRTPETNITPVAAGNSGAGVYLIDSGGNKAILKVTPTAESVESWTRAVWTQRAAADLGLAPALLHADANGRAVVSTFVADRSFPAYYGHPQTRDAAITALGTMVRGIHSIEPSPTHPVADPLGMLHQFWNGLHANARSKRVAPAFVYDLWHDITTARAPQADRAPVLSHNDLNPTNLVYDGERLMLFDWQTTALNDPFYDLATIAMFLRMDEQTTAQLLSVYDETSVTEIPARFKYFRRMAAALSGCAFLCGARQRGYLAPNNNVPVAAIPTLGDIYGELRSGLLDIGAPAGQWRFGLALLKETGAM